MKSILCLLSLLTASASFADQHEVPFAGLNLAEANALQMNLCTLRPKKSLGDRDDVMNAYLKWAEKNDAEVYVLRATPMFVGPNPTGGTFDWIDLLVSPYAVAGGAWDKWLRSEDGQEINGEWLDTADCYVAVNPIVSMYLDREALAGDTRVMTFNWCTRRDGVSWDQLIARHESMLEGRTDDSPIKAWTIMYRGLGQRTAPGEFAHLLSYADAAGLMARQNALSNGGGWRQREDYYTSYAGCTGENAYFVEVLNRP